MHTDPPARALAGHVQQLQADTMNQLTLFDMPAEAFCQPVPKMPEAYRGKVGKHGQYTATAPREWTDAELKWMRQLRSEGFTQKQIAESVGRSEVSVMVKLKRLDKLDGTYNAPHVAEKYAINDAFLQELKPKDVLDLYCGAKMFYKGKVKCMTNDKNENVNSGHNMDALKLLCKLYVRDRKFDLIDLDPFGSAYDCLDLAVKLAKRGLIVTLGELGHKRFCRLDYVSSHYDIDSMADFTLTNLIRHIQMVGKRNKKNLTVYAAREWRNIGRVWFKIEPLKITSQWKTDDDKRAIVRLDNLAD